MPNFGVIERILRELPPFEIGTYLLLPPIFRKWRTLSFYWTNVRQIPKNKTYLIWCILLICKITTKYTVYVHRKWPYTICICSIGKHRFWRPSWTPSWKKHFLSGPILVDFIYLLYIHVIHVRNKLQTDTTSHCFVMHISVGTVGTGMGGYVKYRDYRALALKLSSTRLCKMHIKSLILNHF